MELNFNERIALIGLLPIEGNYSLYKSVDELRLNLKFSEAEIKEHKIRFAEKQVFYENEKNIDITIGESIQRILVEKLTKMEKEGKINSQTITLYEKLILPLSEMKVIKE